LDVLLPLFEKKTGIKVSVISVGTGKALKLGENGDVDLVLVHARELEEKFVKNGFGINRKDVMHNDFIILGPKDDPAEVKKAKNAIKAFTLIAKKKSGFVSRGDKSGTHVMELNIWKKANLNPMGTWYKESGTGMEEVIMMANNMKAYTFADRGTYLAVKNKITLEIIFQSDKVLFNPYGIIAVNPAKHKQVKFAESMKFINWIVSKEGKETIQNFKKSGETLFFPSVVE
jgi:tungstate transport system substrate-binding protein